LNISIVGDSFGCGEWRYRKQGVLKSLYVSHTGTQHYLRSANHTVQNFSEGGASSDDILHQIIVNKIQNQILIVFATDSLRGQNMKYLVREDESLYEIHRLLFMRWLNNLKKITQQQKCDVILIGGHANLYPFDNISNIQVCTVSWLSDILGPVGELSGIDTASLEMLNTKSLTDIDKQFVIDAITQRDERMVITKQQQHLMPDQLHPSHECHKTLAQKILKIVG
tara:strand:- start:61 stop:735 length:675 start_codon:yes stop_codon:yes gene_type:complete